MLRIILEALDHQVLDILLVGQPGTISSIDRIDFANDTASVSPKGPLSDGRNGMRAASPKEYGHAQVQTLLSGTYATPNTGYFAGGRLPSYASLIDRIDYSNDTATASPKGPLSDDRINLAATSSSSFGYFGGGDTGPVSTVDRIDYLNDTATVSSKGPLSAMRTYLAATGNANFGYFGGGLSGTSKSTVSRIDYSNDTATGAEKGPLSAARGYLSATGNQNFGYFGGGNVTTTVDRIDYSNGHRNSSCKRIIECC